jgi:hypothetical protein
MWSTWALPSKAKPTNKESILTDEQVYSWREKGFALVDDLLPSELVDKVAEQAIDCLYPLKDISDFGSNGLMEYPTGLANIDEVTLHPRIIGAAAQLLNIRVRDLRMIQSDLWMKHGKPESSSRSPADNTNQRVHCGTIKDPYFSLMFKLVQLDLT